MAEVDRETLIEAAGERMRVHHLTGPTMDRCVCDGWVEGDDWDDHLAECVLDTLAPLIADAIEAMPIPFTSDDERMAWGHAVRISVAEAVRSLGGNDSRAES